MPDQPCGMPGGAAGELLALKQYDIADPDFCQVVGDGASDDASADDDDLCVGGQCVGHGRRLLLDINMG